jgi:hypothetical protein
VLRPVGIVLLSATLTSCSAEVPEQSSAQRVANVCPPTNDSDHYLHRDVAILPASFGEREREWLSNYLTAAEAESLSCGAHERESYRMLYVQEASRSVVVSVTRTDLSSWAIDATEFAPRRQPTLSVERRSRLTRTTDDVRPLLEKLERARVWTTMPAWLESDVDDGAMWIVEVRRDQEYRILVRHAPRVSEEPYRQAVRAFVELTGWAVPKEMSPGVF